MLFRAIFSFVFSLLITIGARKKNSLSETGAFSAFFVGLVTCLGGYRLVVTLFAFFISSSMLTNYASEKKRKVEAEFKKGGNRTALQVFANGGWATFVILVLMATVGFQEHALDFSTRAWESLLLITFLSHYACCNGDTWSSEIGIVSKAQPILITNPFKTVPRGTNGGVSLLGLIAAAIGGIFIGILFYIGTIIFCDCSHSPPQWPIIIIGFASGFFGSVIDSIIGATLQFSGWSKKEQKVVNYPGPDVTHISGYDILKNDQVNFISSILTSLACAFITYTFFPIL
eukprot:TRINITY_DN4984_c0_g1_i3.p1 TRINITY_DN4984_c0_g1~~TRINITY_DN4984_c0_g1_i3.p1  ORF type:complete len:287 (+),score=110.83 TRINITY_DN4984_c0_g1_i3:113-973(+)